MSKQVAVPKPKRGVLSLVIAAVALTLIISNPLGSADAVHHVFAALGTFAHVVGGGR